MLQVYQAFSFQGIITGSKNSPWLVLANAGGMVKPYVIKFFDRHRQIEGDKMAHELMGNLIAAKLGLHVPGCALIDLGCDAFCASISSPEALNRFHDLKLKIALGTEYLYPHLCFFPGILESAMLRSNFKPGSVFALDILIRNTDRNGRRPNLLMHLGLTYLIDFESSFGLTADPLGDILVRARTHCYYYMHVFYRFLLDLSPDAKSLVFEDFMNKLEQTDFSFLDNYILQLKNAGFEIRYYQQVKRYLQGIEENREQFGDVLKSLLDE